MKAILRLFMALSLLLAATSSFAWGGNNSNWGPFGNNGWGNNYNPYDEWDPRYWMEEMENTFDDDGYYGGPGSYGYGGPRPYGPPPGYYGGPGPYGYGGPGPYGPPPGRYGGPGPYGPPPGRYGGPGPYGPPPGYGPNNGPRPYGPPPGYRGPAPQQPPQQSQ